MDEKVVKEVEAKMEKTLSSFKADLNKVRTGRASLALFDDIRVDYYGTPTPLNQMATLAVPEPRLITIQPWDTSVIGEIEKAILKSDLGLNPNNDGTVIRLALPQLTEERRREIAKQVRKRVEDARVAARNVRRDCHDHLRHLEHDHQISQDDLRKAETELQKLTDEHIEGIDKVGHEKEEEVLAV